MNENYIETIKNNLDTIIQNEYIHFNYEPLIYKEKEIKINNNLPLDVKIFNNKLNKISKMKNYNSKENINNNVFQNTTTYESNINIFDESNDNVLLETNKIDKTNKSWKKLNNEEKIEKLNIYIEKNKHINIPEDVIIKTKELINNNKLNCKRYIIYNTTLEIIEDLPLIQLKDKKIVLLTDIEEKKKKLLKNKKKINSFLKI
jgi:hypothetical protein